MKLSTTFTPRILSIAGTDPSGGAGAMADLKSIGAAGGYGMSVITALVAQNTQGVRDIFVPPQSFLREQLDSVSDDVTIDAVKIGMLGSAEIITTVTEWLNDNPQKIVVVDPVMVATSGDRLLDSGAEAALRKFLDLATVITPNIPELVVLAGEETSIPQTWDEACTLAVEVAKKYDLTVIVKGGHLDGAEAGNAIATPAGLIASFSTPRIDTPNTHGTGCSLSSALATRLGAGEDITSALEWVTCWLHRAIATADSLNVGHGHGPINHFVSMEDDDYASALTTPEIWQARTAKGEQDQPRIASAGPATEKLWHASQQIREEIADLPFITQLSSGTLSPQAFTFYQDQDAQYLQEYSRALGTLGAHAPHTSEQLMWLQDAASCLNVETELHKEWLGTDHQLSGKTLITQAYTDFLISCTTTKDYVVGVAAVLPCYWLYGEIGLELADKNHSDHPYNAWLSMYGGDEFIQTTHAALKIAERTLTEASPELLQQATEAFLTACYFEKLFFDQASHR